MLTKVLHKKSRWLVSDMYELEISEFSLLFPGERDVKCMYTANNRAWMIYLIIVAAVIGATLLTAGTLYWIFRSTIIRDLRVWELNRLKSRWAPARYGRSWLVCLLGAGLLWHHIV